MTSRNSIWWKLPGVVIWMAAVGLLAAGYTSKLGVLFALSGVVSAFALATWLEGFSLRLSRVWLCSGMAMGLTVLLSSFFRGNSGVVGLFGSETIYG